MMKNQWQSSSSNTVLKIGGRQTYHKKDEVLNETRPEQKAKGEARKRNGVAMAVWPGSVQLRHWWTSFIRQGQHSIHRFDKITRVEIMKLPA